MKISEEKFQTAGPLTGLRSVLLEGLPINNWREELPKLFGKVGPSTLIVLQDTTQELNQRPMYPFLKHTKLKGLKFAHFAHEGVYPEWLQYLDHTIIKVNSPRHYKSGEDFNEAIQELWFMRGQLNVWISITHRTDLEMAELLYSYTPNDLPFWIDVDGLPPVDRPEVMHELLSRRFSTVRVI